MARAVDLADEAVEVVRVLDEAVARWAGDSDRDAVADAIAATDQAIVLLHRVRDALVREARTHDAEQAPHDGRD